MIVAILQVTYYALRLIFYPLLVVLTLKTFVHLSTLGTGLVVQYRRPPTVVSDQPILVVQLIVAFAQQ